MTNRSFWLGAAAGLAAGLVVALFSYQVGRAGGRLFTGPEAVTAAPVGGAPAPAMPPAAGIPAVPPPAAGAPAMPPGAGGAIPLEVSERIQAASAVVGRDPKNVGAWVELGNLYFDTHQPQKSIDAYARALELQPDSPDVLTDQGVMYRAVGAFEKAIANFQQANRLQPAHLQSLYNLGVVYAFDLKDVPKAEAAWNRLIQLAPNSENASQARQALAQLKGK